MDDGKYMHIITLTKRILSNQKRIMDSDGLQAVQERPQLLNQISESKDTIRELTEHIESLEAELKKANNHIDVLRQARNAAEEEARELKRLLKELKEKINV